ncbi:ATP-binding cassette domain-containing protein [Nitratifractor sp.]
MTPPPILDVRGVTVRYKDRIGIRDASLQAHAGEILGFIGADGAGKSSLLHAIAGVIAFDGTIAFDGHSFHSPREAEPLKGAIGLMPQGIGLVLYEELTVMEHLEFFARIRGLREDEAFLRYRQRLLEMAGLAEFPDRLAGALSGGMMQKLSLICTLLHRPRLLLLDEPTTGVDPLSRLELWEILDRIRREEGTVALVSTAYMQEAQRMDRVFLFDGGSIIAQGGSEALLQDAKPHTYAPVPCPEGSACIATGHFTYSLDPLDAPHKEPTLEALFFLNALRKGKTPPPVTVGPRESDTPIPPVVLEARGLTKRFGNFVADDHIDLQLHGGEIVGLLGANGAGKTTLIKMLLGLHPIDEGELQLLGRPIRSAEDRRTLKARIGYVSQHFALYDDLTVRENLIYFARMHGLDLSVARRRIERYARELGFDANLHALPTELPLGINQRFSVAAALLHEPVLLFLDEPTSGVDAIARSQFWQMLHLLKERWGISILITTHYMSEAEFCDRVVLLRRGHKIADDTVEALHRAYPDARSFEEIFLHFYREKGS